MLVCAECIVVHLCKEEKQQHPAPLPSKHHRMRTDPDTKGKYELDLTKGHSSESSNDSEMSNGSDFMDIDEVGSTGDEALYLTDGSPSASGTIWCVQPCRIFHDEADGTARVRTLANGP
jgi:hypothetical protein